MRVCGQVWHRHPDLLSGLGGSRHSRAGPGPLCPGQNGAWAASLGARPADNRLLLREGRWWAGVPTLRGPPATPAARGLLPGSVSAGAGGRPTSWGSTLGSLEVSGGRRPLPHRGPCGRPSCLAPAFCRAVSRPEQSGAGRRHPTHPSPPRRMWPPRPGDPRPEANRRGAACVGASPWGRGTGWSCDHSV